MTGNQENNSNIPDPPRGKRAILWRLPIWIYRLRLGWIFGHRMLLLTHKGRVSGKPRQAVLEVVKHDKETRTYYVASGFGKKSQWFQNIMKTPEVTVRVGNNSIDGYAERLSSDEGKRIFQDYQRRHPNAIKNLSKLIGYEIGEGEEGIELLMRSIPVIKLQSK
jgi:deazaflavin-dependent oxidoreductase (nitroreductase family)